MKNIKIVFSMAFALIMAYTLAISPAHALTTGGDDTSTGNGGDTSSTSTTGTENGGNTSGITTGNGGDTSGPATGNGGNTSGPATGNGGDTSGPASAPATQAAPASSGRGSGGRISSGTGYAINAFGITSLPAIVNIGNCSYITTYMKFGKTNDVVEVKKLQAFLKNTEGINVDINGIFDEKTLDAVKAFQTKYVNDTMAPWGVNTPTGQVFFTTQKKINEIYCKANFKLSAEQLSAIEAYKKGLSSQSTKVESESSMTPSTDKDNVNPEVGSKDAPLKANVSDAAKTGKIKGFFKWLFGY